jgi:hypothetical protein
MFDERLPLAFGPEFFGNRVPIDILSLLRRRGRNRLTLLSNSRNEVRRYGNVHVLAELQNACRYAYETAFRIEESAAARTRRDRCARQNSRLTPERHDCAAHAFADGESQPQRIADGENALPTDYLAAGSQWDGGVWQICDVQQAQICFLKPLRRNRWTFIAGVQNGSHGMRIIDDMAIGYDLVRPDYDAAAFAIGSTGGVVDPDRQHRRAHLIEYRPRVLRLNRSGHAGCNECGAMRERFHRLPSNGRKFS